MPWHRSSEYAHASHFRRLDGNDRARWRCQLHIARKNKRLSADAWRVADGLLRHHAENGRCDPSHARLAAFAGCTERTVRRALDRLAACGLVAWTRRIVRTRAGARQTSSAYRLLIAGAEQLARIARMTRQPRPEPRPAPLALRSDVAAALEIAATATRSLADWRQQREAMRAAAYLNRKPA
jgi:hypothetical protein